MTIAIYGNRRQQQYLAQIDALLSAIHARGIKIIMHAKLYTYLADSSLPSLGLVDMVRADGEPFQADIVLSIGGDGTFLNTARWVADRQIPIMGVNTGHLGYLAATDIAQATSGLNRLISGDYSIEERSMLQVVASHADILWPYALNEVAILKKDTSSMLNINTCIDSKPLATYRADGLIIATPTGSTGYNLSVGGPILQPTTPAFVIAPIAPHSLSMRPVVIDDRAAISTVTDTRSTTFLLSLDGHSTPMPVGCTIDIRKAPFVTRVIHLTRHYSFVETLRSKLHWGN